MPDRISKLNVNSKDVAVDAPADERLLFVLRDQLDLVGAKYGCGEGQCGACTVLLDGMAVRSCITTISTAQGKRITTIEGLAENGRLHPVQQAFIDNDAYQCGYCTPGMIMASVGLLRKKSAPSETEIRQGLNGNVCRCGTYPRIVAAVRLAATMKSEVSSGD